MAASRTAEELEQLNKRAEEAKQIRGLEASYELFRRANRTLAYRVLGKKSEGLEGEGDSVLSRGDAPIDPSKPMPKDVYMRRVGGGTSTTLPDIWSTGDTLSSHIKGIKNKLPGNQVIAYAETAKDQQDCWALHKVFRIVLDNNNPNDRVLAGFEKRLQAMMEAHEQGYQGEPYKNEAPPRAIRFGEKVMAYIDSKKDANGKLPPRWENLLAMSYTSQDNYTNHLTSELPKVEAKKLAAAKTAAQDAAKDLGAKADDFNNPTRCPPAKPPVEREAEVNRVYKEAKVFLRPVEEKLEVINTQLKALEARAAVLETAKKELTGQIAKNDAILKANPGDLYAINAMKEQIEIGGPERMRLLAAMQNEQKQIDGIREMWKEELAQGGYPADIVIPADALNPQPPLQNSLRERLQKLETSSPATDKFYPDTRKKFEEQKDAAQTKADDLKPAEPSRPGPAPAA